LYLCHARLREFRGQTLYAVPSGFLDELPRDAIEEVDVSMSTAMRNIAQDAWRTGGKAAQQGWADAGVKPAAPDEKGYAVGVQVRHAEYGLGRITDISGSGFLRRVRVRFATAGERTFIADKAKLEVVREKSP
jgi:DNA helicase-2/ATP-dependent DNA helicase PcrA